MHVQQTLWTDEACSNNQDVRFRRAGSGIFYCEGCVENLGVPLPGVVQTNQRAELFAVVLACFRDPRPLDIRSDSKYVCDGFQSLLLHGLHDVCGDHHDLRNLLAHELRSRVSSVRVCWVKGHAKQIDVVRGLTTKEDMNGNDGADELAVAGASMHKFPSEVVSAAKERKDTAVSVQQMMVVILKARFLAEGFMPNDVGDDRGSDMSDCTDMELINDETDSGDILCDID